MWVVEYNRLWTSLCDLCKSIFRGIKLQGALCESLTTRENKMALDFSQFGFYAFKPSKQKVSRGKCQSFHVRFGVNETCMDEIIKNTH